MQKRSVATEVLDIVSKRNVDDKRERARVKKRKQREKKKVGNRKRQRNATALGETEIEKLQKSTEKLSNRS